MVALGSTLKKIIMVMLAVATMIMPDYFTNLNKTNEPINTKKCQLNFVAVSDTHVEADGNDEYNDMIFNLFMSDLESAKKKADALVVAGDITHHGEEGEWKYAQKLFSQYKPAEKILLAQGNHDTWTSEGKKTHKQLFVQYAKKISGEKISKVYYSTKLNGYTFIFLGSEKDTTYPYFSSTQLKWLDSQMKAASKDGKPIFVVSHWPMNKTHGLPQTWGDEEYTDATGGIGDQSSKVKKILNKYKNVVLISGHIHSGFSNDEKKNGYESIETYGNITSVNLPTVNAVSKRGHFMLGTGYNIEVYKTKVIFRARNYAAGCWLPEYDFTLKLK